MYAPWDLISTDGRMGVWRCPECGRVVLKASEPTAWRHNQDCRHSPHQTEERYSEGAQS
jgi:ABC-type ATPase with predicted acetyltransferase domain